MNSKIFEKIYQEGLWNDNRLDLPRSGPGSLYEHSLPILALIDQADINSILDVGCGDLTYIKNSEKIMNGKCEYTGWDISESIINENKDLGLNLQVKDILKEKKLSADLIILKDILFHMTNQQICKVLEILSASSFKYCVMTNFDVPSNKDRELEHPHYFFPVNIKIEPFYLKPKKIFPRVCGGEFVVIQGPNEEV